MQLARRVDYCKMHLPCTIRLIQDHWDPPRSDFLEIETEDLRIHKAVSFVVVIV